MLKGFIMCSFSWFFFLLFLILSQFDSGVLTWSLFLSNFSLCFILPRSPVLYFILRCWVGVFVRGFLFFFVFFLIRLVNTFLSVHILGIRNVSMCKQHRDDVFVLSIWFGFSICWSEQCFCCCIEEPTTAIMLGVPVVFLLFIYNLIDWMGKINEAKNQTALKALCIYRCVCACVYISMVIWNVCLWNQCVVMHWNRFDINARNEKNDWTTGMDKWRSQQSQTDTEPIVRRREWVKMWNEKIANK